MRLLVEAHGTRRRGYHGVPRRFVYGFAGLRPRSACLFDPEFTPALGTDLAIDERAGIRLLEEGAVATLLITLWCVLIFDGLLSHLSGSPVTRPSKTAAPAAPATLPVTIVRLESAID